MSVAPVVPADVLGSEPQDWPLTIGVALPIPEPFLSELGAYRERFGDPLAHAIVAHITLVPPTQVADEQALGEILAHLQVQAASMVPFPLVLEGAGTFRPISQVVFVPIVEGEAEVRAAEAAVRSGPLDRPLNFPYHPHVTVAHDLEEEWLDQAHEALLSYRAAFEVDRLSLFIQGADAVWRPVVDFPFGQSIIDPQRYAGDSVTIGVLDPADFPDAVRSARGDRGRRRGLRGRGELHAPVHGERTEPRGGGRRPPTWPRAGGSCWWRETRARSSAPCRCTPRWRRTSRIAPSSAS